MILNWKTMYSMKNVKKEELYILNFKNKIFVIFFETNWDEKKFFFLNLSYDIDAAIVL